jgi:hypothetical protein
MSAWSLFRALEPISGVFIRHLFASSERTTTEQRPTKYRTTTEQMSLMVALSYAEKASWRPGSLQGKLTK